MRPSLETADARALDFLTDCDGAVMDTGTVTQLITVAATLGGVVLTLIANAYLERRRARDVREMESLHLSSEHAKWLRDERLNAYLSFLTASEEVLQFIRSELPVLVEPKGSGRREGTETRWHKLRAELRKSYNQVALFGDEDVRTAALHEWLAARNGVDDFLHDLDAASNIATSKDDLTEQIRAAASRLGSAGGRFLEVSRKELQG